MQQTKKIQSALVSVFNKDGLEPIVKELNNQGVTFYSTGGTETFLKDLGIPVVAVEDVTSYPSILGGRVKTLHPKIFGGILNRRSLAEDQEALATHDIPQIDLVIVDLYPFEETVASGASHEAIIEKIGPTDRLLIYFSGHGHYDQVLNEGYWIPQDAKRDVEADYLPNSYLVKMLKQISARHVFIIADACFSGSLFIDSDRENLDNAAQAKSRWALTSGRLEYVDDGVSGQHSPIDT
jgi:hypothetical protein